MFSCEFCEISKNTFFTKHLWMKLRHEYLGDTYSIPYQCTSLFSRFPELSCKSYKAIFLKSHFGMGALQYICCIQKQIFRTPFFSIKVFFHGHWQLTEQQGKGGYHLFFHWTTSTRSQTFRHLFTTLHVRWLSHIFNRTACICQTATQWDLLPYRITIWVIDDVMLIFVCLLVDLILGFLTAISHEKPVDSYSHLLSSLHSMRTD